MRRAGLGLWLLLFTVNVFGSQDTIGNNGIRSAGLTLPDLTPLNGSGVPIGQVEPQRPSKPNFDTVFSNNIVPTQVFIEGVTNNSIKDMRISDHPQEVAGVIISKHPIRTGVAQSASLFSSATVLNPPVNSSLVSMQAMAMQTVNDINIRALNLSYSDLLGANETRDGNSQFTLGTDWLATKFDVLNVVAGGRA